MCNRAERNGHALVALDRAYKGGFTDSEALALVQERIVASPPPPAIIKSSDESKALGSTRAMR